MLGSVLCVWGGIAVRLNLKKSLMALAAISLMIPLLVGVFSYYRFGSNPRLAYAVLENCEAALLKLVRTPDEMKLLRARIFLEGLADLEPADINGLERSTRFKTVVERGQGKYVYPTVRLAFKGSNSVGAPQKEEVTCQYGGIQFKDGTVLNMRLMYTDLGPMAVKNPFLYKEDGFQGWAKQGLEEWVDLDDISPSRHWKHFLDSQMKVLEWEDGIETDAVKPTN